MKKEILKNPKTNKPNKNLTEFDLQNKLIENGTDVFYIFVYINQVEQEDVVLYPNQQPAPLLI